MNNFYKNYQNEEAFIPKLTVVSQLLFKAFFLGEKLTFARRSRMRVEPRIYIYQQLEIVNGRIIYHR